MVMILKLAELLVVPLGVVTLIGPVTARRGTTSLICAFESTVNEAGVPFTATADAWLNPEPFTRTLVPAGPCAGTNEHTAG